MEDEEMRKVFTIHILLRNDSTYYGRVEGLKDCRAYAATLHELLERLEKAIALALEYEEVK